MIPPDTTRQIVLRYLTIKLSTKIMTESTVDWIMIIEARMLYLNLSEWLKRKSGPNKSQKLKLKCTREQSRNGKFLMIVNTNHSKLKRCNLLSKLHSLRNCKCTKRNTMFQCNCPLPTRMLELGAMNQKLLIPLISTQTSWQSIGSLRRSSSLNAMKSQSN